MRTVERHAVDITDLIFVCFHIDVEDRERHIINTLGVERRKRHRHCDLRGRSQIRGQFQRFFQRRNSALERVCNRGREQTATAISREIRLHNVDCYRHVVAGRGWIDIERV